MRWVMPNGSAHRVPIQHPAAINSLAEAVDSSSHAVARDYSPNGC
jgi:hypothetical protein